MSSKGSMSLPTAIVFFSTTLLILAAILIIYATVNSVGVTGDGYEMSEDGSGKFYVTVYVTADKTQIYRIEVSSEEEAAELAEMNDEECYIVADGSSLWHGLRVYGCRKVE